MGAGSSRSLGAKGLGFKAPGWATVLIIGLSTLGAGDAGDVKSVPAKTAENASKPTSVTKPATASRLALAAADRAPAPAGKASSRGKSVAPAASSPTTTSDDHPIARALRLVADCRARYEEIDDYTCTFYKRERINGRLLDTHIMFMKARTRPHSIYIRFKQPSAGREAIYVEGRNQGKVLAHDVGLGRLIAGTLQLDPRGARAMEDCRHPITEAGIGRLLDTVWNRWSVELTPEDSRVSFRDDMLIGDRPCTMIESTHPARKGHFLFHKVRLFIDQELRLPIRFEGYDWPPQPGVEPPLAEEYTYTNLRLNPGLQDRDFDVANPNYSFGRF